MRVAWLYLLLALLPVPVFGAQALPEFTTGHQMPELATPAPREALYACLDLAVLAGALGLASWLAVKRRSRRGLFVLMLFSLLYFGFYKKGCVCPIGAIQNVALALADSSAVLPYTVLAIFFLPLLFTLFFGRTFCASVCPLGGIQDLCLLKPVRVPEWLEQALGLLPFVYLGAAVLFAVNSGVYIICQYDPFVAFFRREGQASMLLLGASLLLISVFVGRAYCRYVCPYGALLGLFSRLSAWHVAITPSHCIDCSLCNDACPFGAIQPPSTKQPALSRSEGKTRLATLLILLPLLTAAGAGLGRLLAVPFSQMDATVRQAERVRLEETGVAQDAHFLGEAFRKTGHPAQQLYARALQQRQRYALGSAILGGFLGLVFGIKLIVLSLRRRRTDYEVVRANCVACARCFEFCPKERAQGTACSITAAVTAQEAVKQ